MSLAAGETHELEVSEHVQLEGTAPFAVAQHLVGSAYEGIGSFGESDPSMAIVLPVSSWSRDVAFHAPDTFDRHLLVVAPSGARVRLDGIALSGWQAVGSTGTSVARTTVASGFHRLESTDAFAATGYGSQEGSSYLTALGGAL